MGVTEKTGRGLTILAFDDQGFRVVDDPGRISDLIADEGTVVWCDLRHPDAAALALVRDEFQLHPLAIEDATKHGQRPKLNHFDTHAFVVAHYSDLHTGELVEVDVFIGRNWIITVHDEAPEGGVFDVDNCRNRLLQRVTEGLTASFLFYLLLDEIVDTYVPTIDKVIDQVETIETRVFSSSDPERDQHEVQQVMHRLRRRLLEFRRRVGPLREVLASLLGDDAVWIDPATRPYLQDVHDHVVRVAEDIAMYREVIDSTVDAHLSLVANHQNDVMKFMTSWGAILMVSTLVAGIYGMNFEHMPELAWEVGYPLALAVMVVCTVLLYRYFKRKNWI